MYKEKGYILYKSARLLAESHCLQKQKKRHTIMQLLWVWINSNTLEAIWQFVLKIIKIVTLLISTSCLETS